MKANDLPLAQINKIIAEMEGVPFDEVGGHLNFRDRLNNLCQYSPVTKWHQGGPIIDREHILLDYRSGRWFAFTDWAEYQCGRQDFQGKTGLEAAMRCYAGRRLPEETDVAED